MTLRLNGATSGYTEIDAPAVAGSNTLTLPTGNGTSGQFLQTNGSGAMSWGSQRILQVVNGTYSTAAFNTTSTFADTGLTATITPSSSSNKILVLVDQVGCGKYNSATSLGLILLRNGVSILRFEELAGYNNTTASNYGGSCTTSYLDSPASTSALSYKTQFASMANSAGVYVQNIWSTAVTSTITLMEVAA